MTISKLIRELQKMKKKTGPRATVVIDLAEFKWNGSIILEYSHYTAGQVRDEYIPFEGKDGSKYNADGSERMRIVVSIGC
jgi:hypothetical protein